MTDQKNQHGDRYDRARSEEEPGAHSGAESQARDRSLPGTAGAKESYQPERGTTAGNPLEGVEAADRTGDEPETDAETGPRRQAP